MVLAGAALIEEFASDHGLTFVLEIFAVWSVQTNYEIIDCWFSCALLCYSVLYVFHL